VDAARLGVMMIRRQLYATMRRKRRPIMFVIRSSSTVQALRMR
jgi:hypothetical protein